MAPFKNLIFDLGNVIIDIDSPTTVAEFQKLAIVQISELISYSTQHRIFDLFETGQISVPQFRLELKKFLKPGVTNQEIDKAWNAILIDFPQNKTDLLKELKTRYKTFALSNINEIHVEAINRVAKTKFGQPDFGSFFHAAYYSNEIGFRKPGKEIYEFIMQKENLKANETFFVDDKAENIETAQSLGLHAYHLKNRDKLIDLLTELKIV